MRYATIDIWSGYVWWVGDAETPEAACEASDLESGNYRQEDGEWVSDPKTDIGYAVYEVPAGFDVCDGQSTTEIAKVEATNRVGTYKWKKSLD